MSELGCMCFYKQLSCEVKFYFQSAFKLLNEETGWIEEKGNASSAVTVCRRNNLWRGLGEESGMEREEVSVVIQRPTLHQMCVCVALCVCERAESVCRCGGSLVG